MDDDYAIYLDDVYDRTIDALTNERFDDERVRAICAAAGQPTPEQRAVLDAAEEWRWTLSGKRLRAAVDAYRAATPKDGDR